MGKIPPDIPSKDFTCALIAVALACIASVAAGAVATVLWFVYEFNW